PRHPHCCGRSCGCSSPPAGPAVPRQHRPGTTARARVWVDRWGGTGEAEAVTGWPGGRVGPAVPPGGLSEGDGMTTFVIIGGGLAGAKAAETLRAEGFDGRVVLVGEETERPYERPPLSKGYLIGSDPREKAFVHEESWYAAHDIELRLADRATMLD